MNMATQDGKLWMNGTMIEQPDANAPAILRAGWLIGKFHGENAATMPIGW